VEDALQRIYKASISKPTPAILPVMHEVKKCTLRRTFWHYTCNEASAKARSQSGHI